MSTKNFIIPTKTIYSFIRVIWLFAVIGFLIKIMTTVAQPTNVNQPIYFSIANAEHLIEAEDKNVAIIGSGVIESNENYHPPLSTIVLSHLKSFARGALILFILFQIKAIIENALEENPLNYQNSDRLLKIGWAILGLGILGILSLFIAEFHFGINYAENNCSNCNEARKLGQEIGVYIGEILSETNILIGMLTIALSSVFKTGALIKEEADLTI